MHSPFPGMDPFLEEPTLCGGFHSRIINSISDRLANILAPHFVVHIEERVYIEMPDDDLPPSVIVPDVCVHSGRLPGDPHAPAGVIESPTMIEPLYDLEIRERHLEIRDARNREVVTTIEVLSPYNKAPNTKGRVALVRTRNLVMASSSHWIEIDLLRAGERPKEVADKSDYYVLLKPAKQSRPYEGWFMDIRDKLPVIAVPLRPPFDDVPLDLQAAFDDTYARAHYADAIDYNSEVPSPRLPPADARWVAERVATWLTERART